MNERQAGRGGSRIEGFSDAVFGFALTLLVVSLEVPSSFAELRETLEGFLAFGLCFALIVWIWFEHYRFFRRFGGEDGVVVVLNAVLLFVVLFYVYPLKFLFGALVAGLTGLGGSRAPRFTAGDGQLLMAAYGAGFVVVFALLGLLHRHAMGAARRSGDELDLFDARVGATRHFASAAVGLLSIALALVLPARLVGISGWVYAVLGPVHGFVGARAGRAREKLLARSG